RTRLSRTRQELLAGAGSRYSPASVCDGLGQVEEAPAPCVVIGKPAEIAALHKARKMRPGLDRNVGATFSFFCAETPSTAGTAALLARMGVRTESLTELRYRGNGWPGGFEAVVEGNPVPAGRATYR